MPDYGHDLQFGVFLSPDAVAAARTLELAQLAEVLRATTWSRCRTTPTRPSTSTPGRCSSAIAARTSAVRVAPNVANLPLRPPVVLAQAVATLDILSDGRVELGLGAGAFWDAIVAVGGPRRTPGEAVDALEEAIAIIRGVWGVDGNRTVDVDGEHYRVKGMHAGPLPAHDIPIWLGALQAADAAADRPARRRLAAQPGLRRPPTAGRDERRHRRGGRARRVAARRPCGGCSTSSAATSDPPGRRPPRWPNASPPSPSTHGTSTFILGTDDPDELRRFAARGRPRRPRPGRRRAQPCARADRSGGRGGRASRRASKPPSPSHRLPTPTPDDGTRLSGDAAVGRDHPPVVRRPGRRVVPPGAARPPPAPRRHPRPPARRAGPGARRRRPGPPRPADRSAPPGR